MFPKDRGDFLYSAQLQAYIDQNPFYKLSDAITEILQEDIISIKTKPGTKMNINKIAEDMGVSRTPVIEALTKLMDIGFIDKGKTANGYYVSGLDMRDMLNLYAARAAIESEAAYCCAKYADSQLIKALEQQLPGFERTLLNKDPAIKDYDLPFHKIIVDGSRNKYLIDCYRHMYPNLRRYQHYSSEFLLSTEDNPYTEEIRYQHVMIVEAVKAHSPISARDAMQTHITACMNYAAYSYVGSDPFRF